MWLRLGDVTPSPEIFFLSAVAYFARVKPQKGERLKLCLRMTAVLRVIGYLFHPNWQLEGKIFWTYHILCLHLFCFVWKGLCFPGKNGFTCVFRLPQDSCGRESHVPEHFLRLNTRQRGLCIAPCSHALVSGFLTVELTLTGSFLPMVMERSVCTQDSSSLRAGEHLGILQ